MKIEQMCWTEEDAWVPAAPSGALKNSADIVFVFGSTAVLQSRELAGAQRDYLTAAKRLELAVATHEREQFLWERKVSAERDLLEARQSLAEAEIDRDAALQALLALGISRDVIARWSTSVGDGHAAYEIRAPLTGVVIEKHLTLGEAVAADADAFVVADLSSLWCDATLPAAELALVKAGQAVTVISREMKLSTEAVITSISPVVGAKTRAATARIELPNAGGEWRPGLYASVEIAASAREVPLVVAGTALQRHEGQTVVFVEVPGGFEARPVQVGAADPRWTEVLAGLTAGERYVGKESFIVKAELGKAGATHEH